ncbi:hypothetical protein MLD38_021434 [Melastoma candidum]|uniref:Uncharacterized protein n=1 Tax=Melastoma candidum TaxID=119954 RepID=A0ACB9QJG7_9MYRT|nr:hypothetical protein MLD38_021434 [Melastoma candidum]
MTSPTKMAKPTSPEKHYPLYIFPSSPSLSSRIQSKISLRIKTIINPFTIPDIAGIILTLLPKAKALLLWFSKEANSRLRIPPDSLKVLLSLLGSIDVKAFVDSFIIPCLKKLAELRVVGGGPRVRGYLVVRRIRLSLSRKFKYRGKRSSSSSYFRFHGNWSSRSYVLPVPATVLAGLHPCSNRFMNANTKNCYSVQGSDHDEEGNEEFHDSQLDGYLEWLEQQHGEDQDRPWRNDSSTYIMSDIDMLAEKFIKEKYGMFILEKQESERMFQEMMARSL